MSLEEDWGWTAYDGLQMNFLEENVDLLEDVEPSSQDLDSIFVASDDGGDPSGNDFHDEDHVSLGPGPGLKGKNLDLLLPGKSFQVEDIVEDAGEETDCETVEGLQERIPIGALNDPYYNSLQSFDVRDVRDTLPPSKIHTELEEDLRGQVKSLQSENERKAQQISAWKRNAVLWGVNIWKTVRVLAKKNEELKSKYADLTEQKKRQEIQMQIVESANDALTEANTRLAQENEELKQNQALTENTLFSCLDSLGWPKALWTEIPESIPSEAQVHNDSREHLQEAFAGAIVVSHAEVRVEEVPKEEASSPACSKVKREFEELLGIVGAHVSSSSEMTENESPTKKMKREQKGPRKVTDGYFRWTRERNLKLLDAMVDILKETLEACGENYVEKEAVFLGKVSERCGNMCLVGKIRDNVNNLLRRYTEGSKRDLKAEPREYIKLLERIRTVIQKKQIKSATI